LDQGQLQFLVTKIKRKNLGTKGRDSSLVPMEAAMAMTSALYLQAPRYHYSFVPLGNGFRDFSFVPGILMRPRP
jgi:hypothetical protein